MACGSVLVCLHSMRLSPSHCNRQANGVSRHLVSQIVLCLSVCAGERGPGSGRNGSSYGGNGDGSHHGGSDHGGNGGHGGSRWSGWSFLSHLSRLLLRRLQLSVRNVHICFKARLPGKASDIKLRLS